MLKQDRLSRELAKLANTETNGICVFPKDDNFSVMEAQITGPENTAYERGVFKLEIIIPEKYPFTPPSIKFLTKIYHPNIDDSGRICLDLMKMPPNGGWKPIIGIEALLIAIRMLLETPNPEDPLMVDIAEEYLRFNDKFKRKAREYTEKYAK
ncbi:ubiquitin-conjugating enzyme E2 T-like [Sitophilus oryzae]|uniref:Ubiquitin-conjugating enzyme E2 T n=1 Tax=Sitophilus oryzae TaxID=7048 RepID=A0A6J2XZV3_SITOR|nr:ubiquitin-conjugating enzyme E2 T-like [Sitophilus oryzae]